MATCKIHECRYVGLSDLVPKAWVPWFYDRLSNGPFSWGDVNHSLVDQPSFFRYVSTFVGEDAKEPGLRAWWTRMRNLPSDIYIDLEG